jgi:1,4-dihydroxy-2-naphthoate octaprenyltransferase
MNTILLLRFPFSFFLLPVSLFSLWFADNVEAETVALVFFIWHALVYPASNGYNSYNDRDSGPIGGLANPPMPDKSLFIAVNIMDAIAIVLAGYVGFIFATFVVVYICFSRLYSYRGIRFKQYPILGYLVVIFFQGSWVFAANTLTFNPFTDLGSSAHWLAKAISMLLIATIYPITQIYQHEADRKDGVATLSMLLGIKGTFLYCGGLFIIVHFLMFILAKQLYNMLIFNMFAILMFPAALYFIWWFWTSLKNRESVNHKNTMIMLGGSALLINLFFFFSLFIV